MRHLLFTILGLVVALAAFGQSSMTQITGIVRDSLTREPLSYVSISLTGSDVGTLTNDKGGFTINTHKTFRRLRASAVGYSTREIDVKHGQGSVIIIDLPAATTQLGEVVVRRGREKYSKKNNPAVELVKRIIARRERYNPLKQPYYHYDKYEKMLYGFNDLSETGRENLVVGKFPLMMEYCDTSEFTGKRILPVSVREKVSQEFYRRSPKTHREYIEALRHAGLDEGIDQESLKRFMDDVFSEIDIYDNDISLLTNRFVSPLSRIGVDYYKYYLNDTLDIGGTRCIELSFVPFTPQSFGFLGRLYIPLGDTTLFIKRVQMNVPHSINLNYVEQLFIDQEFVRGDDGLHHKVRDYMEIDFRIIPGTSGLFARRETLYSNHSNTAPDEEQQRLLAQPKEQVRARKMLRHDSIYWTSHTPAVTRGDVQGVNEMLGRLRQSKFYWWNEKIILTLIDGYLTTGKNHKWDWGPVGSIFSGNTLEGFRLRLGGMTNLNLSDQWFAQGYMAYGFKDKRLKYMGQLEYSFIPKERYATEFPVRSIRAMHRYDIDKMGRSFLYTNADNTFLSITRQKDDKIAYLRTSELEFKYEWDNHFSMSLQWQHLVHEASHLLPLTYPDGSSRDHYTQSGFKVELRYAPHEKVYQTRSYRFHINHDYPIFTLSHTWMPRGFMGSRYTVNRTDLGINYRLWLSAFGYTDFIVKGSKIWSRVAYPDLLWPNANLSYTIEPETFELMNSLEFANDQCLSWDMTYWGNGILMNRLPLIKRLKLREVIGFRGLWGSLSSRNDPMQNSDLPLFPSNALCQSMGSKPYMELSVGLDNILTFLRLDYVWRLTYRDTPGVDRGGIRFQIHIAF